MAIEPAPYDFKRWCLYLYTTKGEGEGHEVTLFASGDSQTAAHLKPACPHALRLNKGLVNRDAPLILMQEQALGAEADQFDIVHSHLDFLSFPMSRRCPTPVLTTLHDAVPFEKRALGSRRRASF